MTHIESDLLSSFSKIKHSFLGKDGCPSEYFDVSENNTITLKQVHSSDVHIITADNVDKYKTSRIEGDSLITNLKGIVIGINTADCMPILMYSNDSGYIAAIHSGWKGTLGGIIENTIFKLRALGCNKISAVIGPAIDLRSFEVGSEFEEKLSEKYLVNQDGALFFDMKSYAIDTMLTLEIKNIAKINVDTFKDDRFNSYRRMMTRDGKDSGGRQFSGILLK